MQTRTIVTLLVLAVGGGVWTFWPDYDPEQVRLDANGLARFVVDESSAVVPVSTLIPTANQPDEHQGDLQGSPARVPVTIETEDRGSPIEHPVEDDPCADVTAERDALLVEVAVLQLELERATFPEDSPYGAFLHSYEAEAILEQRMRNKVKYTLDTFPLLLRPGEATWVTERYAAKDWKIYAPTIEEAIIGFLGPQRVLAEVPFGWVDEYKRKFDAAEWLALFGTPMPD